MEPNKVAKELLEKRDLIDAKIAEHLLTLETNGATMDSRLVDDEGYPLNNIDIISIRNARHELICLRNDRAKLSEEIMEELTKDGTTLEQPKDSQQVQDKPVHRTSNEPFARVSAMTNGSPADQAGLKINDNIIQYGHIHFGSFKDLSELARLTKDSENKTIRVTVERNGLPVRLQITPRSWDGPGLLGCNIVPLMGKTI